MEKWKQLAGHLVDSILSAKKYLRRNVNRRGRQERRESNSDDRFAATISLAGRLNRNAKLILQCNPLRSWRPLRFLKPNHKSRLVKPQAEIISTSSFIFTQHQPTSNL